MIDGNNMKNYNSNFDISANFIFNSTGSVMTNQIKPKEQFLVNRFKIANLVMSWKVQDADFMGEQTWALNLVAPTKKACTISWDKEINKE